MGVRGAGCFGFHQGGIAGDVGSRSAGAGPFPQQAGHEFVVRRPGRLYVRQRAEGGSEGVVQRDLEGCDSLPRVVVGGGVGESPGRPSRRSGWGWKRCQVAASGITGMKRTTVQRDATVGSKASGPDPINTMRACAGGSSNVLRKALAAASPSSSAPSITPTRTRAAGAAASHGPSGSGSPSWRGTSWSMPISRRRVGRPSLVVADAATSR